MTSPRDPRWAACAAEGHRPARARAASLELSTTRHQFVDHVVEWRCACEAAVWRQVVEVGPLRRVLAPPAPEAAHLEPGVRVVVVAPGTPRSRLVEEESWWFRSARPRVGDEFCVAFVDGEQVQLRLGPAHCPEARVHWAQVVLASGGGAA